MTSDRIDHAAGVGCVPGAHGEVRGAAHTPTPWRIAENEWNLKTSPWRDAIAIEECDCTRAVPPVVCWMTRGELQEEKAALIVRAVNAHAGLVAVVKEAKLQIEYLHEKFGETGTGNATLARIDAALARAEQP